MNILTAAQEGSKLGEEFKAAKFPQVGPITKFVDHCETHHAAICRALVKAYRALKYVDSPNLNSAERHVVAVALAALTKEEE